ncbi:MAG TPA: glutamate synthase large subunit, partial [Lysobacter sp.]
MDASPQPGPQGLYNPRDERDACGFGLIAQLDDAPSKQLVQRAIDALVRMTHRGGVAADGLSGDGCGVLNRKPDAWLRALAGEVKITLGPLYAAGLVFLPHDEAEAARAREAVGAALREVQLAAAGWRVVPVDVSACGARAQASMPRIEQLFVVPALDNDGARPTPEKVQHSLCLARRRAEQRLRDVAAASNQDFYVVTLSAHAIGYKG